jgi:hypothetical protein
VRWGDKVCPQCGSDVYAGYPEIACAHPTLPIDQASQPFDALGKGFDNALTVAVYADGVGFQHAADIPERRAAPSRKGLPR